MFNINIQDPEAGLFIVNVVEVGKTTADQHGMDGTQHRARWVLKDAASLTALRRGFYGKPIVTVEKVDYPAMVELDVIVSDVIKPTCLTKVAKRSDIQHNFYVLSSSTQSGAAVSSLLRKFNLELLSKEIEMCKELNDINVVINGHNAVSFNSAFGWVNRMEFTVCGDQGIDTTAERLSNILDELEPVPHQNLACFEEPANAVADEFDTAVLAVIKEFRENKHSASRTITMRVNNAPVTVFSIMLTAVEPKFEKAFL